MTNMSIIAQLGERKWLDKLVEGLEANDNAKVGGFINDAVLYTVKRGNLQKELESLKDLQFTCSAMKFSVAEFQDLVKVKFGELDWSPLPEVLVKARLETMELVRWLHPHPGFKDPARGGRPYLACARGVAPYLLYNQNRTSKSVEWYDVFAGVWRDSGGEFLISGDELNTKLSTLMVSFHMELVEVAPGKKKFQPVQLPAHPLLKDPAFLGSVGSLLKSIRKE